jgi:hypothetical protein
MRVCGVYGVRMQVVELLANSEEEVIQSLHAVNHSARLMQVRAGVKPLQRGEGGRACRVCVLAGASHIQPLAHDADDPLYPHPRPCILPIPDTRTLCCFLPPPHPTVSSVSVSAGVEQGPGVVPAAG